MSLGRSTRLQILTLASSKLSKRGKKKKEKEKKKSYLQAQNEGLNFSPRVDRIKNTRPWSPVTTSPLFFHYTMEQWNK